ncbi:MAG TPA: hypothetical protein VIM30_12150 [Candidatus Limnocylindrales bacterium]
MKGATRAVLEPPIATVLVAAQVAMVAGHVALSELGRAHPPFSASALPIDVAGGIGSLAFAAVGLLIVLRRPGNRIGWLFVLANLGWDLNGLATSYVEFAHAVRPLPAVEIATWLTTWPGPLSLIAFMLLIVLFPDGRAPSPRWRRFAQVAVAWGIVHSVMSAFASGPVQSLQLDGLNVDNPLGLGDPLGTVLATLAYGLLELLSVVMVAIAAISMVIRLRRSTGLEHQQLKWLTSAVVLTAILWIANTPIVIAYSSLTAAPPLIRLVNFILISGDVCIPIAAGIAILRYRLYDIDRIISRTLAYAVLTAILAGVYVVGFLGLQSVLAPFTANGGPVAVAASTLVVFALFAPVRRRIQVAVDRRFYRSRYHAAREIESFAARVRDEVEVDRLAVALSTTLKRTMQPVSASIWLRSRNRP